MASLEPDALRGHHLALALALEPLPVDPEILSVHWSGCGRFTEASRCATLAADAIIYKQHAAEQYFNHGHIEKGYSVLTDLVRAVGVRLPERGASALASLLLERFRLRVRALPYRRPAGADREEMLRQVDVCLVVGKGLAMIEPIRAMEFQSRALRLALTSGDPKRIAIGLALEAAFEGSDGHTARRRVDKLLGESEKLAVCWNLSYLGRLGEAAAYVRPLLKEAG